MSDDNNKGKEGGEPARLIPAEEGDLVKILAGESFSRTVHRIFAGFRAPKDSGEYRYAKFALLRMFGPGTVSLLLGIAVIVFLFTYAVQKALPPPPPDFIVERVEPVTVPQPDPIVDPTPDNSKALNVDFETDIPVVPPPDPPPIPDPQKDPGADIGDELGNNETRWNQAPEKTISPRVLSGILVGRTKVVRDEILKKYPIGSVTEAAVLKALRWLKAHQNEDGSWGPEKIADTGLALLTFLAHGETPDTQEFGPTVERGIKYLIEAQKKDGSLSANAYSHGIATYALCESYALTGIMSVRDAAEKALQIIIDGQGARGGYDYGYAKTDRWDMSVSGWQFQAMKAGKLAGLSNSQLDNAIAKMHRFLKEWTFNGLGWGYAGSNTTPVKGGGNQTPQMTSVGALVLQLYGQAKGKEVRKAVEWLGKTQKFEWPKEGKVALYDYYYQTQVRFQNGDKFWTDWNDAFSRTLVREQKADGHWEGGDHEGAAGLVYTTTMCALMLQVYYRYLPTQQKVVVDAPPAAVKAADDPVVEVL